VTPMFITEERTIWLELDCYEEIRKRRNPISSECKKPNQLLWSKNGALRSVYKEGELLEKITLGKIRKSKNRNTNFAFQEWEMMDTEENIFYVLSPMKVDWGIEYKTSYSGRKVCNGVDINHSTLVYRSHLLERLHQRRGYKPVTAKRLWDGVDARWIQVLRHLGSFRCEENKHLFIVPFETGAFVVSTTQEGEFGGTDRLRPSLQKKYKRLQMVDAYESGLLAHTFIRKDQMFDKQLEILELIKEEKWGDATRQVIKH